jgi:hypothetical protein
MKRRLRENGGVCKEIVAEEPAISDEQRTYIPIRGAQASLIGATKSKPLTHRASLRDFGDLFPASASGNFSLRCPQPGRGAGGSLSLELSERTSY